MHQASRKKLHYFKKNKGLTSRNSKLAIHKL